MKEFFNNTHKELGITQQMMKNFTIKMLRDLIENVESDKILIKDSYRKQFVNDMNEMKIIYKEETL